MSKLLKLVKVNIQLTFNPKRMLTRQNAPITKGKSALYGFLMLIMLGYFLLMSCGMFYFLGSALSEAGFVDLMIYLAVISFTALVLLLSVFAAQGYLYKAKDLPLLLSLPVSHFSVLLSKFILLYVYDLFFALILLGPAFFFYFYFTSFTISGIIGAVICILAAPLIPIALGSLLSYFLSLMTRRMRKKNIFTIVFTLAFIVVWMVAVQSGERILNYILEHSETLQEAFSKYYFPTVLAADSLKGEFLSTLVFFVINALSVYLVFFIISKKYSDIVAIINTSAIKKKQRQKKAADLKRSSALKAMIRKELHCYFGSVYYILNTMIGPLLLILGSVALLVMGADTVQAFSEISGITHIGVAAAAVMCMLLPSLSPTTSVAVSLEGKKLWIYKSIPANIKDILKAKTYVNLIMTIPAVLISAILLSISFRLNVFDYITIVLLGSTFSFFTSLSGILINIAHPKLDFENEIVVIKQSLSVMLQMLAGMVSIAAVVIAYVAIKPSSFYVFAYILIIILWAVIILLSKKLFTWGVRRFAKL